MSTPKKLLSRNKPKRDLPQGADSVSEASLLVESNNATPDKEATIEAQSKEQSTQVAHMPNKKVNKNLSVSLGELEIVNKIKEKYDKDYGLIQSERSILSSALSKGIKLLAEKNNI